MTDLLSLPRRILGLLRAPIALKYEEPLAAMLRENRLLKEKVVALEKELQQSRWNVFFREPWYYARLPDGTEDGPFCPNCYDTKDHLLVRAPRGQRGIYPMHECPSCRFYRREEQPPARARLRAAARGWRAKGMDAGVRLR